MSIRSAFCAICAIFTVALATQTGAYAQQRPVAPVAPSATAPAPTTPPVTPAGPLAPGARDDGYIMGPEDIVEVEVVGRADFKVRQKIGTDGMIPLPLIGPTQAASKTSLELAEDVKTALEKGGYFRSPIMRVEIVGYASRYVTVLGSVGAPGLVPVDRPYRLSEILARVGGVRPDGAEYVVLTSDKSGERKLSVRELATGGRAQDPFVSPGDKIYSPQAELFFISGQVKAPGGYPVSENMTVRMAVAKGGGMTDIGSEKSIKVTHKDGRAEKPGMNGKVSAGDVIVVGERLF
jgi:polysaccharide biosynthesis/export protein